MFMKEKKDFTRRQFLKMASIAGAGGALTACTPQVIEKIVEVPVEKIVEKQVTQIVEKRVTQIVKVEAPVPPGLVLKKMDEYMPLDEWNPTPGGTLRWGTPGPVTGFNPVTIDGWSLRSGDLMYEGLFTFGPNNEVVPHLATGATLGSDRITWTIPLRKDVKFHDDTPFNADAVKFNFDLFLDETRKRGEVAGAVAPIASVEKVDEFTIKIKTKQPQALFLASSLQGNKLVFASPAAYRKYGEDLGRNPVGTGPFMFKEWKESVSVKYVRNPDYKWAPAHFKNRGPAYPDEYHVMILAQDAVARALAFEAGEVDFIAHFNFLDSEKWSRQADRKVLGSITGGMPWFLHINTTRWPTDDRDVRLALNMAINKKLVCQRGNGGIPPTMGGLLTPGTQGYSDEFNTLYPSDAKGANKLLDDKGYTVGESGFRERDGKVMQVEFPNTPNPLSELYKLDIESSLKIKVEIPAIEFATYINEMAAGKYTHQWTAGPGPDGDVLWPKYHSSNYGKPGRAFAFYVNQKVDALLDGARMEFDSAKRTAMWLEVQKLLMDYIVAIPLATELIYWAFNKTVGGQYFRGVNATQTNYDLYVKK